MSRGSTERLIEPMTARRDELSSGWIGGVSRTLAGRVNQAEPDRELHELYGAIIEALRGGGEDADGEPLAADLAPGPWDAGN